MTKAHVKTCLEVIQQNWLTPASQTMIGDTIFKAIFDDDPDCLNMWNKKPSRGEDKLKALRDKWTPKWDDLLTALQWDKDRNKAEITKLRRLYRASAFRKLQKEHGGEHEPWLTSTDEIVSEIGNQTRESIENAIKLHYGITVDTSKKKSKTKKVTAYGETYDSLKRVLDTLTDDKIQKRLSGGSIYKERTSAEKKAIDTLLDDLVKQFDIWQGNVTQYKHQASK